MLFLEYPKCSTCKKAKNWLESNGVEFEEDAEKELLDDCGKQSNS